MNMVKSFNLKKYFILMVLVLVAATTIPAIAEAVDYPGSEDGETTIGNTAQTEVGLKADESQLSFTAPAVINFAMKADGKFEYPTTAKFTNNSIFDLRVKSFAITNDSSTKGVAASDFESAEGDNVYKLQVKPSNGSLVDFALSQTTLSASQWLIGHLSGANSLGLAFDNGEMKNVVSGSWVDGHKLQDVVWTISAA